MVLGGGETFRSEKVVLELFSSGDGAVFQPDLWLIHVGDNHEINHHDSLLLCHVKLSPENPKKKSIKWLLEGRLS